MSKQKKEIPTEWPEGLSDAEVCAYLRAHPDFLKQNPEVLDDLNVPARVQGRGVVDFQQVLMEKLRHENTRVRQTQRHLVETSRANLSNQARVHSSALLLLEARSFEEFIRTITQDLAIVLDVDAVSLVIESNGEDIPHAHASGVRIAPFGFVEAVMGDRDALLRSNIQGSEDIYGAAAGSVFSDALLRLEVSDSTPLGVLAFGARNPEAFHPDQGTELIGFLGHVVERCLRLWLDIPE